MSPIHPARVTAVQDFLANSGMFLNLESQKKLSPGDIIVWTKAHGQFDLVTRLASLGVTLPTSTSDVTGTELYNSASGVAMRFDEKGPAGLPTMNFKFAGTGRYSIQAHDSTVESIDEVSLAAEITQKAAATWEPDWIVVTSVWQAAACTILISGGNSASAGVCASTAGLTVPFNIADLRLGVSLGYGEGMHSQEIANKGACPFFVGMKYHAVEHHQPRMVRFVG